MLELELHERTSYVKPLLLCFDEVLALVRFLFSQRLVLFFEHRHHFIQSGIILLRLVFQNMCLCKLRLQISQTALRQLWRRIAYGSTVNDLVLQLQDERAILGEQSTQHACHIVSRDWEMNGLRQVRSHFQGSSTDLRFAWYHLCQAEHNSISSKHF